MSFAILLATRERIQRSVLWEDILLGLNLTHKPRRSGAIVMLCVFHQEKTASLRLYPASKTFHCYGCGAGGDMFDFVQAIKQFVEPEDLVRFFYQLPTFPGTGQMRLPFS